MTTDETLSAAEDDAVGRATLSDLLAVPGYRPLCVSSWLWHTTRWGGLFSTSYLLTQIADSPEQDSVINAPCRTAPGKAATLTGMTGIQPELWIDRAAAAVAFYQAAFGARVLHQVGEGDEIVAQLAIGDAAFWVSPGGAGGPRFSPGAIGGATGRTLLLADDPDAIRGAPSLPV